jgi:hypothetical protein
VKKSIEPAEVSNEEEDKANFLDQEYSGLYDDEIWECIECYLNLPTGQTTACSTTKISRQLCQFTTRWQRQWHYLL